MITPSSVHVALAAGTALRPATVSYTHLDVYKRQDILGIWGDPAVTGKAAGNDILRHVNIDPCLLYTSRCV